MAFEIPSSGSIDLGGTSDRSIAALANIKGNFNETSSVHLSGMRDWYRTYIGEDNAENLPMAGDGISLGDFREAAVFGVEVRTRNESRDTDNYKNSNNARIYARGVDGSGSYQFQLVQTTGASNASYTDTDSGGDVVTIEAVNSGPDGNDIELTGTGSSPATFSGNVICNGDVIGTATHNVSITLTGDGVKTINDLRYEYVVNNPTVVGFSFSTGGGEILGNGRSITLTHSGGTCTINTSTAPVLRNISISRSGASVNVAFTLTGNGTANVFTLLNNANISTSNVNGGSEVPVSGEQMVASAGVAETTMASAVSDWNLANPTNQATYVLTDNGGGTTDTDWTLDVGEIIILAGGAAGYDQTKTTAGTNEAIFTSLGGSAKDSRLYRYDLIATDLVTEKSYKLVVMVGYSEPALGSNTAPKIWVDGSETPDDTDSTIQHLFANQTQSTASSRVRSYIGAEDPHGESYGPV